ncbi:hypothetical protein DBR11_21620 [Pedobacter sp. HMWF019]|uniref:hypothetical protein n=1 Tax=Pedobacter sp. HMWF019 TaxID=2056856 RepID=UPI000D39AEDE|nr:hypothetical protein [Pedobacter sp. HMWF019]PTS95199.1 hypothetical protein DBR11_21620 [Pedobacter sp. HMWF019]
MNSTLNFPLKVWLTSIFIGPLFLLLNASNNNAVMFNTDITQIIDYVFSKDFAIYYLVAIGVGGACSMPCFLLLWLCYVLLGKTSLSALSIRGLLILFSMLCSIGIFMLFSMSDLEHFWNMGNIVMMASYALPLLIGLLIYKMHSRKQLTSSEEQESQPAQEG